MSANHRIYIKHNLTDNEIRNIDKIILEKYEPNSDTYFEYLRENWKICEKQDSERDNRDEIVITLKEYKQKYTYNKVDKIHARIEPSTLTEEESNDDSINLYGYNFHNWIVESLNAGRFVEINIVLFNLMLSSTKTVMAVDCFTGNLCFHEINKYSQKYNAMRKFVYELVKTFDSSKDYKALYIHNNFSENMDIIEDFEEKKKSFNDLYNKSLNYFHIDAVNPPTEEEWLSSGNRRDKDGDIIVCPIVIDDFRDFKELENT
jgi:hypothetical protein